MPEVGARAGLRARPPAGPEPTVTHPTPRGDRPAPAGPSSGDGRRPRRRRWLATVAACGLAASAGGCGSARQAARGPVQFVTAPVRNLFAPAPVRRSHVPPAPRRAEPAPPAAEVFVPAPAPVGGSAGRWDAVPPPEPPRVEPAPAPHPAMPRPLPERSPSSRGTTPSLPDDRIAPPPAPAAVPDEGDEAFFPVRRGGNPLAALLRRLPTFGLTADDPVAAALPGDAVLVGYEEPGATAAAGDAPATAEDRPANPLRLGSPVFGG